MLLHQQNMLRSWIICLLTIIKQTLFEIRIHEIQVFMSSSDSLFIAGFRKYAIIVYVMQYLWHSIAEPVDMDCF